VSTSIRQVAMRLLLLPALFGILAHADCYSHDGIAAMDSKYYTGPELISCGRGTNNCCLKNEKCGSNLLCYGSPNIARQYCADKNWSKCSTACADADAAGVELKQCPTDSNVYCCGGNCDCSRAPLIFVDPLTGEVSNGTGKSSPQKATWWAADSSTTRSSTSSPSPPVSSAQVIPFATSPLATPFSSTSAPSPSSASTQTSTPPSSDPSPSASSNTATSSSNKGGLSTRTSVGIGVGCTAAAVLVGGLLWLFVRERRKRRMVQNQLAESHASQYPVSDYDGDPNKDIYGQMHTQSQVAPVVQYNYELDGSQRHELR